MVVPAMISRVKQTEPTRTWTVLLVGGNGGSGKSTLGLRLAAEQKAALAQVDDIRLALQRVTNAQQEPALHFFLADDDVWSRQADELCDALIAIARRLEPALEAVVDHHLATGMLLVLEGDGISPGLASRLCSRSPGRVEALFLIEDAAAPLLDRMRARGRGFGNLSDARQRVQVNVNVLYGQWLRGEARRLGLAITTPSATEES